MAGVILSDENFAALESAIDEALEAETPQSYTAAEVVSKYQNELRQIIKKYNHEKALEILKSQGIEITKFTLIQYLSTPKKQRKSKSRPKNKPKNQPINNNNRKNYEPSLNSSLDKDDSKCKQLSKPENNDSESVSKLSGNRIDSQSDLASEFNLNL